MRGCTEEWWLFWFLWNLIPFTKHIGNTYSAVPWGHRHELLHAFSPQTASDISFLGDSVCWGLWGHPFHLPAHLGRHFTHRAKGIVRKRWSEGHGKTDSLGFWLAFFLDGPFWTRVPCPPLALVLLYSALCALSDQIHGSHHVASRQICNEEPDTCMFQSFIYFFFISNLCR